MKSIKYIPPKRGLRVLGIAESFSKGCGKKSILAGVVMRADLQIDGFSFSYCTVGGMDATNAVKELFFRLNRPDIRVLLLSGVIIAYYNIIDLHELYNDVGRPIIAITYEESPGIEKYLKEFPDAVYRIEIYRKNGSRIKIRLKNGYFVYIRPVGISLGNAIEILNLYAIHGRYVEPIRVARILAKALHEFLFGKGCEE